jgi:hypothetical protein
VIVHDFHIERLPIVKAEANAPLIVDADAVLPGAIAFQRLQPVSGRALQITQIHCGVERLETPGGSGLDGFESRRCVAANKASVSLHLNDVIMNNNVFRFA